MRRGLGFKPLRQMEGNLRRVSCGVFFAKRRAISNFLSFA
jgi:hypothetical protein